MSVVTIKAKRKAYSPGDYHEESHVSARLDRSVFLADWLRCWWLHSRPQYASATAGLGVLRTRILRPGTEQQCWFSCCGARRVVPLGRLSVRRADASTARRCGSCSWIHARLLRAFDRSAARRCGSCSWIHARLSRAFDRSAMCWLPQVVSRHA